MFDDTKAVYGASRLSESLSESLSISSMRQLSDTNLLGSLGGDIGECGRGLIFLSGGEGVSMLLCACCVKDFFVFYCGFGWVCGLSC